MNGRDVRHERLDLVGLQMPDEMPADPTAAALGELSCLFDQLLDVVFAEIADAEPVQGLDFLHWLRLAHRHESYRGWGAPSLGSRGLNTTLDLLVAGRKLPDHRGRRAPCVAPKSPTPNRFSRS